MICILIVYVWLLVLVFYRLLILFFFVVFFFFQAEDGIRDAQESRGLGDVYKRQLQSPGYFNSSLWDTLTGEYYRSFVKKKDYFHVFDYWQWDEKIIEETLRLYLSLIHI